MTNFYELTPGTRVFGGVEGRSYPRSEPLIPCDSGPAVAYNLERFGEDRYRLTLAVPGFARDDLEVFVENGSLYVIGDTDRVRSRGECLHLGLEASLERTFLMLDPLNVAGYDVSEGLLSIDLENDPVMPGNVLDLPGLDESFRDLEMAA